jgi:hypothetical protein
MTRKMGRLENKRKTAKFLKIDKLWKHILDLHKIKTIFILTGMLLSFGSMNAQKVFSVDYENQADVKVFVVNYENQADLKVYKVKYENQAGDNDGKWFFTKYSNQAKKKIYFMKYENQADLKIYFVDYENQAGWRSLSKKMVMY